MEIEQEQQAPTETKHRAASILSMLLGAVAIVPN